jgi:DNA replication protein DnaC
MERWMNCKICNGLKKVVQVVDSEPVAAPCPQCSSVVEAEDLRRRGVPGRFLDATFDTFDADSHALRVARDGCASWALDPKGWIVISGPPGVGKTHLLCSIAHANRRSTYVSSVELFALEKKRFDNKSVVVPDYAQYTGILLFDELGAGLATDWEKDVVHRLVAVRYDEGLPTAFATNFRVGTGSGRSLEKSCRILPHTTSRILGESRIIEIDSYDRRGSEPKRISG